MFSGCVLTFLLLEQVWATDMYDVGLSVEGHLSGLIMMREEVFLHGDFLTKWELTRNG